MRYLVALGFTCLVVGSALGYHAWIRAMVATITAAAHARMGVPPGTPATDFGVEVSGWQMQAIELDHFLRKFWVVLLSLVLVACFGLAAILPRARPSPSAPPASSEKS